MSYQYRILHLRASGFVGGPERQILRYAASEKSALVDVVIGTFLAGGEGSAFLEETKRRGLDAVGIGSQDSGVLGCMRDLKQYLRTSQIALVCTHGYKALVLALPVCRALGIPIACFLRGWTGENAKVKLYEAIERVLILFAGRVVSLSELQAEKLRSDSRLSPRVRVVTNSVETRIATEAEIQYAKGQLLVRYGISQNLPVVATAGRLSPEKGLINFLHALPEVIRSLPQARFIVFGDGFLRGKLERIAERLAIQTKVVFAGHVLDFRQLLPGIELLINPSLSEEMPNVVLEAMSASVPVIATAVGGVPEIAGQGAVTLVNPGDSQQLAREIVRLLGNPDGRRALGQAGYQRVAEQFSPERQREQLRQLYEELLPGLDAHTSASEAEADNCVLPSISVVIPVHNEEATIGRVLSQVATQDYPAERLEIIVADGESTDATVKIVQRHAQTSRISIRCISNPKRWSSAGRNAGVLASRGEIIVFVDGHCWIPSPHLLKHVARTAEKTGADVLCRPQPLTFPGNNWFEDVVAHTRAAWLGHGLDSSIYSMHRKGFVNPTSSGAIYRRSVFERIGFYDERFDACEDVEFNYRAFRAGLTSYIGPDLAVFYRPRSNLSGLLRQTIRYGRGRLRLIRKHKEAFSVSQLMPALLVVWMVLGLAAGGVSRLFAAVWSEALIGYMLLLVVCAAGLAVRYGWKHLVWSPMVFLAIHLGFGIGFWREALDVVTGCFAIGGAATVPNDERVQPVQSAPEVVGVADTEGK